MKLDLHMHPLCHEYYNGWHLPHDVKELTSTDEQRIRDMVDWNIARGMDVISITDHDMVLPSLYAIAYVHANNLPITVVPGIEMELHYRGERVHLCAWGIRRQPEYSHITPVDEVVNRIHDMGGIVCMNHPHYSRQAFSEFYKIVDGYEYWNGGCGFFEDGKKFLEILQHPLAEYRNSDYHYDPPRYALPKDPKYFPPECNVWTEEYGKEWLTKLGYQNSTEA